MSQTFFFHVQDNFRGSDTYDLHDRLKLVIYRRTKEGQMGHSETARSRYIFPSFPSGHNQLKAIVYM